MILRTARHVAAVIAAAILVTGLIVSRAAGGDVDSNELVSMPPFGGVGQLAFSLDVHASRDDSGEDAVFVIRVVPVGADNDSGMRAVTCEFLGMGGADEICYYASPEDAGLVPSGDGYARDEGVTLEEVPCPPDLDTGANGRCVARARSRPLAGLLGHEISIASDAAYIPFRGEIENSSSAQYYTWSALLGQWENLSWRDSVDNETTTMGSTPLGLGQSLDLQQVNTVQGATGHAAAQVRMEQFESVFEASGRLIARTEGLGGAGFTASASAAMSLMLGFREPVHVSVTNCGRFDPRSFEIQGAQNVRRAGDTCTFEFSGSAYSSTGVPDTPSPFDGFENEPAEDVDETCAIALRGSGSTAIEGIVLAEASARFPDALIFDQTEAALDSILNEIELGSSDFADPEFRAMIERASANLAAMAEPGLVLAFEGSGSAEGRQTVTATLPDQQSLTFDVDFDALQSIDDLDGVLPDIMRLIEDYLGGC